MVIAGRSQHEYNNKTENNRNKKRNRAENIIKTKYVNKNNSTENRTTASAHVYVVRLFAKSTCVSI